MKKILYLLAILPFTLQAQTITTIAGGGTGGDGVQATAARLYSPGGVAYDHAGNMYISENSHHTIRKVSLSGTISTVAGNDTAGYSGDGGPATNAKLSHLAKVAIDNNDNLYIVDNYNGRIRIVDTAGIITTFSPVGIGFSSPTAIVFDNLGNMFVGDGGSKVVYKIAAGGTGTIYAGHIGSSTISGDGGPATFAGLGSVSGLSFDAAGNLYIADGNARIRIVSPAGIINTFAGSGSLGYSGDGGPATAASFDGISAVVADASGNVYISEKNNTLVRKVNAAGIVTLVAGRYGMYGFTGDGGPATAAKLNGPAELAINSNGELVICDQGNNRIRKIGTDVSGVACVGIDNLISVYPNPAHDYADVNIAGNISATIQLYNEVGQLVATQQSVGKARIDLHNLPVGLYLLKAITDEGTLVKKLYKN